MADFSTKDFKEKFITPLKDSLQKEVSSRFTTGKNGTDRNDYWLWIGDSHKMIGAEMAHYELRCSKDFKNISVDIHFEDRTKNMLFYEPLKNYIDDKKVEWIPYPWFDAKSIRYKKSFDINSSSLIEDIKKALLYLDDNLGNKIRKIMNDLNNQTLPMWEKIIKNKYQIILQGAPGTGKTYNAKSLAYQLVFNKPLMTVQRADGLKELENSDQFALIQFHPAYSYEDFVRGITAKSNGQSIEYITENKILAKFAQRAHQNYLDSQKPIEQQFQHFVEYVKAQVKNQVENNGNKFHLTPTVYIYNVTDEQFECTTINPDKDWKTKYPITDIFTMYKADIKQQSEIEKLETTVAANTRNDKPYVFAILEAFRKFLKDRPQKYVLIIDEINRANLPSVLGELIYALEYRGESVKSMYAIKKDNQLSNQLILPKNLFIIGTMNTADRSVGHIDYAIRRRFAFLDVLPQRSVVQHSVVKADNATKLFDSVAALFCEEYKEQTEGKTTHLKKSKHLASDFKPEDVMLGHSYFIAKDDDTLRLKLEYEIKPILREYLKDGILLETAKDEIEKLNV